MVLKKASGNMYDWVTHIHSHLAGACLHKCRYCYVQTNPHGVSPKYKGEPRLIESELKVNYGTNKIIFIEHMNDLFERHIDDSLKMKILEHCRKYPDNTYVLQTKNPEEAFRFMGFLPYKFMMGTTIESDKYYPVISKAPSPYSRYINIRNFKEGGHKIFLTIEPIMDFDLEIFSSWIIDTKPDFINIGADSKGCNLPEPSKKKLLEFIEILQKNKINIKKKSNLGRLLK